MPRCFIICFWGLFLFGCLGGFLSCGEREQIPKHSLKTIKVEMNFFSGKWDLYHSLLFPGAGRRISSLICICKNGIQSRKSSGFRWKHANKQTDQTTLKLKDADYGGVQHTCFQTWHSAGAGAYNDYNMCNMCKAECVKRIKQQKGENTKLIITVLEVAIKTLFSSSSFLDVTQHGKWWVFSGKEVIQRNIAP